MFNVSARNSARFITDDAELFRLLYMFIIIMTTTSAEHHVAAHAGFQHKLTASSQIPLECVFDYTCYSLDPSNIIYVYTLIHTRQNLTDSILILNTNFIFIFKKYLECRTEIIRFIKTTVINPQYTL